MATIGARVAGAPRQPLVDRFVGRPGDEHGAQRGHEPDRVADAHRRRGPAQVPGVVEEPGPVAFGRERETGVPGDAGQVVDLVAGLGEPGVAVRGRRPERDQRRPEVVAAVRGVPHEVARGLEGGQRVHARRPVRPRPPGDLGHRGTGVAGLGQEVQHGDDPLGLGGGTGHGVAICNALSDRLQRATIIGSQG